MKAEYLKLYSKAEQTRLRALDALFTKWEKTVGDRKGCWFVPDGFYPHYFLKKTRILYMGRDAYDLYGKEDVYGETTYIEKFIRQYLAGKMDSAKGPNTVGINRVKFHKMLIQVAFGLLHDCPWMATTPDELYVPYASEICENEQVFDDAPFAFMNLCKWSHESTEGTHANWDAISEFVDKSATQKRNFYLEEIEILNPDIIITLNFGPDLIARWTGNAAKCVDSTNENCFVYRLACGKKEYMIFDSWHFSARKSEERAIYNPLWEMTRKWCSR